jgi:hypothetical protein
MIDGRGVDETEGDAGQRWDASNEVPRNGGQGLKPSTGNLKFI